MLLGGQNLTHALTSTRFFVFRNTATVNTHEFGKGCNTFKDDLVRITAVQAYPESFEPETPYEWPNDNVHYNPSSYRRSPSPEDRNPLEQEGGITETATAGSKRNSDELQSSSHAIEENPQDPQEIRKKVLASMFCGGSQARPAATKKSKHNPCTPANASNPAATDSSALTDVDIITANLNNPLRFSRLPRTRPDPAAISYIFQTPDYPGKFNPEAAMALNVKKGKNFSELVKGNTVLSEDGQTVYPHQVISGARPGRVVMVIDCPTVAYLSSLVNAKEFEGYQDLDSTLSTDTNKLQAECIIHLADHAVLSHPKYKEWMQRFGPDVEHIVANEDYCSQKIVWRSQSRSCHKLSALNPTIFPVPYYNNTPEHGLEADFAGLPIKVRAAESMLSYNLEPTVGWNRSEVIEPIELSQDSQDLAEDNSGELKQHIKEYYELVQKAKDDIANDPTAYSEVFPGMDIVMTTLGTGSSHPSKYRNVSATLMDMHADGTLLLDVGEGTYGQMFRQFGGHERSADQKDSVDDRIRRLKGIFISHLHADHHLGTVTIIDRWNKLKSNSEPLYLIAPFAFDTFLRDLSDVFDFGYRNVRFIHCEDITFRHGLRSPRRQLSRTFLGELLRKCRFSDIATVDVIHCKYAYGIRLKHEEGWKVVYSGDTRPCNNLVDAGQEATVLLHEATFEDDMRALAVAKRHSTTQEAIMVGEGMGAKYTLLTHFSQRYPKIPQFDAENKSTVIGLCFDQMSVRLDQIPQLPKFLPALQVLFSEENAEGDEGEEVYSMHEGME